MTLLTRVGSTGELVVVAACVALVAFGVGPLFALGTGSVVSSAPPATAGSVASLSETSNVLGSTLGLALLGTVGTAIYRDHLEDGLPAGVPAVAADAARETIGGAAAAAAELPAGPAGDLLGAANEAFTRGLNGVAAVGVVVVVAVIVAVRTTMRQPATEDR
jgi:DHA2 family multidrug resistance protein-like MFS transporter